MTIKNKLFLYPVLYSIVATIYLFTTGNINISSIISSILMICLILVAQIILTIVMKVISENITFTNTKSKQKFIRLINILTFSDSTEYNFEFDYNQNDLRKIEQFRKLFPEIDYIEPTSMKLKGFSMITDKFLYSLERLESEPEFSKIIAGIDTLYQSDEFKNSKAKQSIYMENYNRKIEYLLEHYDLEFSIYFPMLLKNYPIHNKKSLEFYNKNRSLLNKEIKVNYNSEFKEFLLISCKGLTNQNLNDSFPELIKALDKHLNINSDILNISDFNKKVNSLTK